MTEFLQAVINSLSAASMLVTISLGLTIIFGVLGVLNFSQGDIMSLAGYLGYSVVGTLTMVGSLIALIPLGIAVGAVFYWALLYPLRRRSDENVLIVTFGAGFLVQALIGLIWGFEAVSAQFNPDALYVGDLVVSVTLLQNIAIAAAASLLVVAVMSWTPLGRNIRAVAQDAQAAELVGINTVLTKFYAVMIAMAVTSVGGIMLLSSYVMTPQVGAGLVLLGFSVVVLGGMGSIGGAVIASLMIGFAVTFTGQYLDPTYANLVPFIVIIVMLLVRPQGIGVRR